MYKKFKMHPAPLLTFLVILLCCGTAFAYDTGEPPGPGKSLMTASSTKAPASQSAIDKHMSLTLTGPPTVGQQQTYNNFIFLGAAKGAKPGLVTPAPYTDVGLVASGNVIYPKGMYSAYGGSGSEKFTAAAQQIIVTQQISMSANIGYTMGPYSAHPDIGGLASGISMKHGVSYYTLARGPDHHLLGGSGLGAYSGLVVPDGAGRQEAQDLNREV